MVLRVSQQECFFDLIPKQGVVFLDTSAFSLSIGHHIFEPWMSGDIMLIEEETHRLACLNRRLENMKNWTLTSRVLREFNTGNRKLLRLIKHEREGNFAHSMREVLSERLRAGGFIEEERIVGSETLSEGYCKEINILMGELYNIFLMNKGNENNPETDLNLIATALIFARDTEVCLFSHDFPLIKTFANAAYKYGLNLRPIQILDERRRGLFSPEEYAKERSEEYKTRERYLIK